MTDRDAAAEARRRQLRRQLLEATDLVPHPTVCRILSKPEDEDTVAPMPHVTDMLCFDIEGVRLYPALQFDLQGSRVWPAIQSIMEAGCEAGCSTYEILNWLQVPHADFGCTPAMALQRPGSAAEIIAAYMREISPGMES